MSKLNSKYINYAVLAIVIIAVLFNVYAALMPTAREAGDTITPAWQCENVSSGFYNYATSVCQFNSTNTTAIAYTNIPLGGIFDGNGVVFIIIMAALMLAIVYGMIRNNK